VGVCDDPIVLSHNEVPEGAADVDAVIGVGGVAENALVLFVEGVHRVTCDSFLTRVDLIIDHRRSLRPDGLKPC
jgi:hypothetical protein